MISLQKTNVFTIKTPNTRRNTRTRVSHEKDDNPIYVKLEDLEKSVDKRMQIEREIKKLRAELKLLKSNAYASRNNTVDAVASVMIKEEETTKREVPWLFWTSAGKYALRATSSSNIVRMEMRYFKA